MDAMTGLGGASTTNNGKSEDIAISIEGQDDDSQQRNPVDSVLNTTETLEHSLSYLLPRDLAASRGVSRTFRNAIDASPRLRRAAFLQTDGIIDLAVNSRSASGQHRFHAWVFDRDKSSITSTTYTIPEASAGQGFVISGHDWVGQIQEMEVVGMDWPLTVFTVVLNPVFPSPRRREVSTARQMCRACYITRQMPGNLFNYFTMNPERFLGSSFPGVGSRYWDMFICLPAVVNCRLSIEIWHPSGEEPGRITDDIRNPTGVKMRDIFDTLIRHGVQVQYGHRSDVRNCRRLGIELIGAAMIPTRQDARTIEGGDGMACPGARHASTPLYGPFFREFCCRH